MPTREHQPVTDTDVEVHVEPEDGAPVDMPSSERRATIRGRRASDDLEPRTKHHEVHVQVPTDSATFGIQSPLARLILQGGAAAVIMFLYVSDQREKSAQARADRETNAQQIREMQGFISRRSDEDRMMFREEQGKQRDHDSKERESTRALFQTAITGVNSAVTAMQAVVSQNQIHAAALADVLKALKAATPKKIPAMGATPIPPDDSSLVAPMPREIG